jgi:hypothetical protein
MPFHVSTYQIEFPDIVFSDVLKLRYRHARPLLWIIPARSFLVNGYIKAFDFEDRSQVIAKMGRGSPFTHFSDGVFNTFKFNFTEWHRVCRPHLTTRPSGAGFVGGPVRPRWCGDQSSSGNA